MDWGSVGVSILRVLAAGLVLGAGLPALFAVGIRLWAAGSAHTTPDGTAVAGSPGARVSAWAVFALVAVAVLVGVAWITQKSLNHYFGLTLFG